MSDHPKPCRWVSHDQPRMLRTHERDCEDATCEGCSPCTERHCGVCGIRHVERLTCPACVGVVRDDLALIGSLFAVSKDDEGRSVGGRMIEEAINRGVNSEAAMLAGPSADVEAWRNRWMSARAGRIPADWLEDCRDELHPLYVLGTWDMLITAHYEHDTRTGQVTVESAVQYLGANLTDLAQDPEFAFEELAREVRSCRGHMEDVLHDGEREDRGAPCPACYEANGWGPALHKKHAEEDTSGASDTWHCTRDKAHIWSEADYRLRIGTEYLNEAIALTDSDMERRTRVSASTVRSWAMRGKVEKRGRSHDGRQLYDVAQVVALRDAGARVKEAV